MRLGNGTEENTDRNGGGRNNAAGVEMQNYDRRYSDYHMSLMNMNLPNVQNMNPNITGFGHYVGTNNGGSDGNMRSPPTGKETGGSMTPM